MQVEKQPAFGQAKNMRRRGFTLIEILTVIVIFGILVSLSGYIYGSALARSRDQQRLSDLSSIGNALEQFYLDNKEYPDVSENFYNLFTAKFQLEPYPKCLVSGQKNGYLAPRYINEIPQDPRHKFTVSQNGPSCNSAGGQSGQYLYVTPVTQTGDSPRSFILAAQMERTKNMSAALPTSFGVYQTTLNGIFGFCTSESLQPNCTHNYYLQPKPGG